jgi:uncharacterized membrane-anchored protein YhcB (DUF1043 family)
LTYLVIALIISLILNVVSIRYSMTCAKKLMIVANNLFSIQDEMEAFRSHVQVIHETEMFYGDTTLQGLINHSNEILGELDRYEDIFSLVVDDEEYQKEEEDLELEENTEEEKEEN